MSHNDTPARKASPLGPPPAELQRHRPRQHSQGFFEPTLPTASLSEQGSTMNNLTASQIAAQAAMQHQTSSAHRHLRNRSQTTPSHDTAPSNRKGNRTSPPPPPLLATHSQGQTHTGATNQRYQNGLTGNPALAATTAANVAFPRSPVLEQAPEKEPKQKGEKSKKKLFSKPKHIVISRDKDKDKDGEKKEKPLPSPNKMGFPGPSGLSRMVNASTASLNEPQPSNNSSMYNLSNTSAVTVIPADKQISNEKEKDKDKEKAHHKHHFLTRQKLKLKDKDEHFNLPLSSAMSNSKPLDPNAPQSLYSFAPSSPGHVTASFGKTMTGLDLRHGARALREKKKEEKASAAAAMDISGREPDQQDWLVAAANGAPSQPGASSVGSSTTGLYAGGDAALKEALQVFGLNNMTPDDAWDFLKVKLLVIFEGEDVRIAVEDLNKLVSIHVQRCVQKHMPSVIVEDLRELLQTGFASLNHSIHAVPDDRLVPHLVQLWLFVFGSVLPFMQAVFLPLDLEFKGRGPVMSMREAKEFWGAPDGSASDASIGDELDVRTIVLISFRDNVILNRYETLKTIFSRLSLESINVSSTTPNSGSGSGGRPSTAASLDPGFASYNSQSSTLLNAGTLGASYSSDSPGFSRSRATSNTSNPEQLLFQNQSFSPPKQNNPFQGPPDSSHLITETVGRMLQCISVLTSVQSGDEAQEQIELLSKALKHNWLGRGRTGRDRRGFVGTRVRPVPPVRQESDADSMRTIGNDDAPVRGGGKWEATIRNSIPSSVEVGAR